MKISDLDDTPRALGGAFAVVRKFLLFPVVRCDRCFVLWAHSAEVAPRLDNLAERARIELALREDRRRGAEL